MAGPRVTPRHLWISSKESKVRARPSISCECKQYVNNNIIYGLNEINKAEMLKITAGEMLKITAGETFAYIFAFENIYKDICAL